MAEGITVCHVHQDDHDEYGGRAENGRRHLANQPNVAGRGWLGNPFTLEVFDRKTAVNLYRVTFRARLQTDPEFAEAVEELRGKRVACWCRQHDESEPMCHLDVVNQFLEDNEDLTHD